MAQEPTTRCFFATLECELLDRVRFRSLAAVFELARFTSLKTMFDVDPKIRTRWFFTYAA